MNNTLVTINTIYYLKLFVTDLNGNPKSGLNITYEIRKSDDDSLIDSGTLIESANIVYGGSYNFDTLGQYYVVYNTPTGYTNEFEQVIVQSEIAQQDALLRALGLSFANYRILNQVYDESGDLTSATVRLYNNATDANNNQNPFAEYQTTIGYTNRLVTSYKSIQIL